MSFTYRGLKARLDRHIVTEEEIDRNLQRLQEQNPRIAQVQDRPTELGDEVVLDYAGYCDGVQFAGGTAENQTLVLGSGMFIPGFEEQLVDKVVEEKVTVHVTFPTEYHAPELAGKDAQFQCQIEPNAVSYHDKKHPVWGAFLCLIRYFFLFLCFFPYWDFLCLPCLCC